MPQEGAAGSSARTVDDKGDSGTPLHMAADWPGFFARGPEVVAVLIAAGADPSAPVEGPVTVVSDVWPSICSASVPI